MKTMRVLVLGVLAAAAWAAPAGVVWAGKPGGGGGAAPPGTIFFTGGGSLRSMDGSGGNRVLLNGLTGSPATYHASRRLHGGTRWFLHLESVPGETGPGGSGRSDLFAVREEGGVRVRLTSDPALKYQDQCEWGADESDTGATIAVLAARWTGTSSTDTVLPGSVGLYTARIAFDLAGNVTGLDAEPTFAVALPTVGASGREFADVIPFMSFSWSPDLRQITFNRISDPPADRKIWLADLDGGAWSQCGPGENPSWSPDGSRIACNTIVYDRRGNPLAAIETVTPDGNWRTTVVSMKAWVNPTTSRNFWRPRWSPDGNHIAYEHLVFAHTGTTDPADYVYRVAADGSGNTNLTPEGVSGLSLYDWCW